MEFTKDTKHGRHHIVILDCKVCITRLGVTKTIKYAIDNTTTFEKGLSKINNICNFDSEVFIDISDTFRLSN